MRKIEGVVTEIKNPLATLVKLLGEIVPLSKDENTNVQPPVVSTKKKKEKFSFFPFFRKALTPVLLLVLLGMIVLCFVYSNLNGFSTFMMTNGVK